jgi:hypothetical protein
MSGTWGDREIALPAEPTHCLHLFDLAPLQRLAEQTSHVLRRVQADQKHTDSHCSLFNRYPFTVLKLNKPCTVCGDEGDEPSNLGGILGESVTNTLRLRFGKAPSNVRRFLWQQPFGAWACRWRGSKSYPNSPILAAAYQRPVPSLISFDRPTELRHFAG